MLKKILLPVDFPTISPPVAQQAVTLAERFQAAIVMLHVATPRSHAAGVPVDDRDLANWNLVAEILQRVGPDFDESLRRRIETLVVRGVIVHGEPAKEILHAAQTENADLIMMKSYGYPFDQFLLGAVTAKVLRWKECPVWTGAHAQEQSASVSSSVAHSKHLLGKDQAGKDPSGKDRTFSIQNILCAVDLGPRSQEVAAWAAQLATAFGARLTLTNVTESMAIVSPGGSWANPNWQQKIVDDASRRLTQLQKNLKINADLLIGSGDVAKVLAQIATKTNADLLVLDCYPYSGNLRLHGYATIISVSIPVVSI